MRVRAFHGVATLCGLAFASFVFAQGTPQPQPQQQRPTQQQERQTRQQPQAMQQLRALDGRTVTVTGCLMSEAAVPGQTPSPAERAGIAPDFLLTNVQVRSAEPGPGATPSPTEKPGERPGAPGAPGAAGATISGGSDLKIKLENVDNDQMRMNLNKQVEVTGRLEVDAPGATARPGTTTERPQTERPETTARGTGDEDLPQLHVTSVRATGQSCPSVKQ
jgi:hypothetical protein